jgi:outer membrane lipoprotein SlyB
MTGMAAMVSMDEAVEEAKTSFGFASQVDAKLGPNNVGYGALSDSAYGSATAPSLSTEASTSAMQVAGLPEQMAMDARPGLLGRAVNLGLSVANPALGLVGTAYGAHSAAKDAQASIGAINDAFGTTMDASYGTAIGNQAKGTVGGLLGGKVGGKMGASLGMSVAGVPGAIGLGMLGAGALASVARGAAIGVGGSNNGPEGPDAGGDGMSNGISSSQAIASTPSAPKSGYVSIDNYAMDSERNPFDRYSDYAAQFFGTA